MKAIRECPIGPVARSIVVKAEAACRCFSTYQAKFFDFERRGGWRGWENWLTVEIGRRLNNSDVLVFAPYPPHMKSGRLDLLFEGPRERVAVEVKVNYIDADEIKRWKSSGFGLPRRVANDAKKLNSVPAGYRRLILLSTCFESTGDLATYRRQIKRVLPHDFSGWRAEWHDCSSAKVGGLNLLLALHG